MADVDKETTGKLADGAAAPRPKRQSKSQQMSKFYSLPAPLRTFPLPTFVPHNPISLFHIVYTWVSQAIFTPSSSPEILYQGWWSPETRSVHVTDPRSIRALWEQGFYGKGSLSRSEPSWLDREKRRRGAAASQTSEEVTRQRRAERQKAKWERARKEREAIDQKLLEERGVALAQQTVPSNGHHDASGTLWKAPVGPLEILALPNSSTDLEMIGDFLSSHYLDATKKSIGHQNGHVDNPNRPDMRVDLSSSDSRTNFNGQASKVGQEKLVGQANCNGKINGTTNATGSANGSYANGSTDSAGQVKCQKSVRFSPTVEQTTFLQSEPPSPELAATSLSKADEATSALEDQEHLQLTMEEAFFLSYGLGVLKILDPGTKEPIPMLELFSSFRQSSYFPPPKAALVSPDDPFLVSYVVYHHFRSLGWVVRGGTKFSVDLLLYNRGPVFSHAEFAVLILPSYSDPSWSKDTYLREYVAKKEKRRWSWLHCINRVNSQVKKTLVLVYVDIPPPSMQLEDEPSIGSVLKRYKIREFVLKRWLSNRSRD